MHELFRMIISCLNQPCVVSRRRAMATWTVVLCAFSLLLTPWQVSAQANPYTVDSGDIDLYLVAEYGHGLTTPRRPPQLTAQAINSKGISCRHRRAATVSSIAIQAANTLESALQAAAAKCVTAHPLQGGLYTLQASYIKGANWATWNCYKRPSLGAASPASSADSAVTMFSSQAVTLEGGFSYTCVATYTAQSAAEVAAVEAIDWDVEVARVSGTGLTTSDHSDDTSAGAASGCPAITWRQPPRGKPPPILDVQGGNIVNSANRQPVHIRGINWFGFNVPMGMVDGLWAGGSDAATDFSTIVYQLSMLGYNAVRLPFAHDFLAKTDVWALERECTKLTNDQMKQRLTRPEDSAEANRKVLPTNVSPMPKGNCNSYLPMTKNEDRFLFVVQQFVALGMYVVLDYQPQGLESYAYNLNDFVNKWQAIWKRVTCLPNFNSDIAGRVLIDVMNEPDSMGIRWEAQGDRPGAEQLYLATADRLYSMSPNKMLFMFEGTGQNMIGLNWGNGFVTDQQLISSRGLSNPINFFNQIVQKPYVRKSVFSPHLYPPSITMSTWLGEALWQQSQVSFAYLQSPGYCANNKCTTFPILVGETGTAYKTDSDKQWMQDFADFVYARGNAAKYNSKVLGGWMWWAYNENSGDTGGIVMNNWQDLHWEKLRFMMDKLGLSPWYKWSSTGVRRRPKDFIESAETMDGDASEAADQAATTADSN